MIKEEEEEVNNYKEKCPNCENEFHKIIRYYTGKPNFVECIKCGTNWIPKSFKSHVRGKSK